MRRSIAHCSVGIEETKGQVEMHGRVATQTLFLLGLHDRNKKETERKMIKLTYFSSCPCLDMNTHTCVYLQWCP